MQQLSLHHMSHCRVFTSGPVPHVFLCSQLATSLLSPMSCLWAHSRILTGSLGLGSPSLLPALLLFLCQLSSWHQYGEGYCCLSVPAANRDKLQSFLCLGCASAFCTVSHWVLTRGLLATPLGQRQLCALRNGHSQGQCQFWLCQSQTVPAGVNRNICILQLISQFTK